MADDVRRRKSDWKRQRLERLNKKFILKRTSEVISSELKIYVQYG